MKRLLLLLFPIVILISALLLYRPTVPSPSSPKTKPSVSSLRNSPSPTATSTSTTSCLRIVKPKENQLIISPLTVSVVVDNTSTMCHWTVFEAQAGTIEIIDDAGTTVGTGILKTTDNWMTNKPVTYDGTIIFTQTPVSNTVVLQITEENPSGKPNPQTVTRPLRTSARE